LGRISLEPNSDQIISRGATAGPLIKSHSVPDLSHPLVILLVRFTVREFSGMIHWRSRKIIIPCNPQQPSHPVRKNAKTHQACREAATKAELDGNFGDCYPKKWESAKKKWESTYL
jgi:hypothetical protein